MANPTNCRAPNCSLTDQSEGRCCGWMESEDNAPDQENPMPIDMEAFRLEHAMWIATPQLRWLRPAGCSDADVVLEQLYERVTGERRWCPVPTCHED